MPWWRRRKRDQLRPSPARNGNTDPPSWTRHPQAQTEADALALYTMILRGDFRPGNRPVTASLIWHYLPDNQGALVIGYGGFSERRIREALEHLTRTGWLVKSYDPETGVASYVVHPDKLR